jgi:hypothetical protein
LTTRESYEVEGVATYLVTIELDMPVRGNGTTAEDAKQVAIGETASALIGGFLRDRIREANDYRIISVTATGDLKEVTTERHEVEA